MLQMALLLGVNKVGRKILLGSRLLGTMVAAVLILPLPPMSCFSSLVCWDQVLVRSPS